MYCKNCGANVNDSAKFCNKCGTPLDGNNPVQAEHNNQQDIDKTVAYNSEPDNQNSAPYFYEPTQPQTTQKKSNKPLLIAVIVVGALLVTGLSVTLTLLLGSSDIFNKDTSEEQTTVSEGETIKSELIDDPINYFSQQPDRYYKVTTDPSADFYIYPEYGSEDHYNTLFAGNEIIYVYGTYNGWACFKYENNAKGYAWCMTTSIYETTETPTEAAPEIIYVPTPTPAPAEPAYSPVSPGSYYRVNGTGSSGLNLRSSPSTSAYVYVVLQESEMVYVHETNGSWSYVSTVDYRTGNDVSGWCANQYLKYAY